jgi:hypothetical protein
MESNTPAGGWRVKMVPIPAYTTVTQLAETADALHSSCESLEEASDSVQRKQRESRFDKKAKRIRDNSDLPNRSVSLRSTITNRIPNTSINDMQKKSSSHYFHQNLNRQQQRLTSHQVPQQIKTLGKLFYAHN